MPWPASGNADSKRSRTWQRRPRATEPGTDEPRASPPGRVQSPLDGPEVLPGAGVAEVLADAVLHAAGPGGGVPASGGGAGAGAPHRLRAPGGGTMGTAPRETRPPGAVTPGPAAPPGQKPPGARPVS